MYEKFVFYCPTVAAWNGRRTYRKKRHYTLMLKVRLQSVIIYYICLIHKLAHADQADHQLQCCIVLLLFIMAQKSTHHCSHMQSFSISNSCDLFSFAIFNEQTAGNIVNNFTAYPNASITLPVDISRFETIFSFELCHIFLTFHNLQRQQYIGAH